MMIELVINYLNILQIYNKYNIYIAIYITIHKNKKLIHETIYV